MPSSLSILFLLCALAATSQAALKVFNLRARKLPDLIGSTDAYVTVMCGSEDLGKTVTRFNNPSPWWDEEFSHDRAQEEEVLALKVFDSDVGIDDNLGTCKCAIQVGTWNNVECSLNRGGTLYYSYTFTG